MSEAPKLQPAGPAALDAFARIVGEEHAIRDEAGMAPYLTEWRDRYQGKAALVLKPASTDEVAKILQLANEKRVAIVPQGGNTGLVGAQIPDESGSQIVLSMQRMTHVRDVDLASNTMTVDAGLTLATAQQVAESAGRLFPLSLASEGSCQIGGVLATNAGGVAVLTYGNARDLALGLEVVLADGRVWHGLKRLRKDNTGYDLRDLFIGSEGTLGIITGIVGIAGAGLTAFYMFRLFFRAFYGTDPEGGYHPEPHPTRWIMAFPVLTLAALAFSAGWIQIWNSSVASSSRLYSECSMPRPADITWTSPASVRPSLPR